MKLNSILLMLVFLTLLFLLVSVTFADDVNINSPFYLNNSVKVTGQALPQNIPNLIDLHPNDSQHYTGLRWLDTIGNTQAMLICHELANEKNGSRDVHNHCTWYTSKSDGVTREGRLYIDSHKDMALISIKDAILVIGTGGTSTMSIRDDSGKYREVRVDSDGNIYTKLIDLDQIR